MLLDSRHEYELHGRAPPRVTPLFDPSFLFTSIGIIITQIRDVDLCHLRAADRLKQPQHQIAQHHASNNAQSHLQGEVAFKDTHRLARRSFGGGFTLNRHGCSPGLSVVPNGEDALRQRARRSAWQLPHNVAHVVG